MTRIKTIAIGVLMIPVRIALAIVVMSLVAGLGIGGALFWLCYAVGNSFK